MNLSLCREDGVYESGEKLQALWRVRRVSPEQLLGLEISVLWQTEGKGDEDLHVHHFERLDEEPLRLVGVSGENRLTCKLPPTPLSYHGHLIQLRWCIRLRLFIHGRREIVTEQPFYLVSSRSLVAAGCSQAFNGNGQSVDDGGRSDSATVDTQHKPSRANKNFVLNPRRIRPNRLVGLDQS